MNREAVVQRALPTTCRHLAACFINIFFMFVYNKQTQDAFLSRINVNFWF